MTIVHETNLIIMHHHSPWDCRGAHENVLMVQSYEPKESMSIMNRKRLLIHENTACKMYIIDYIHNRVLRVACIERKGKTKRNR